MISLKEMKKLDAFLCSAVFAWRTAFLDRFFKVLNFFDSQEFYLFLISLFQGGSSRAFSLKFFYVACLSLIANTLLKQVFRLPRPSHVYPDHALVRFPLTNYGLPSGAAQNAVLLSFFFSWEGGVNSLFLWSFGLLLSFSRLYLGAHFFSDILTGWFCGGVLFLVYLKTVFLLQHLSFLSQLCLSFTVFFGLSFIKVGSIPFVCNVALGMTLGLFLENVFLFSSFSPLFQNPFFALLFVMAFNFLLIKLTRYKTSSFLWPRIMFLGLWLSFIPYLLARKS